ncbi:reverse transcriptase [Caerostris extrusa]|uniref:Reverse transcriptase n=1 Tax=Caerostris extrusa TaxID=172846 RepID=A0AAV4UTC3_CAEEX|nr:reverse transcriptase [Caerostris extrusa]
MADAKMELRMWTFGPDQELSLQNVEPISPVLGFKWDRIEDSLFIPFKSEPISNLSKRKLLSIVHSVFDPLGFVVPLKFERRIGYGKRDSWSLHVFCDASKSAYATVIFLRSESSGQVYVKFVAAKSRISPLNKVTIPRLELLACVLEQEKHFHEKENSVHGLQVVRGDDDVLRVKTRIIERDDDLSFLYPILLPSKHYLTECLIREYHLKVLSCRCADIGSQIKTAILDLFFQEKIRFCVSRCVVCKRFTAKALTTPPIQLPLDRVYRAIHLEPLTSLSTESFMQALRKFIARRGRPSTVYTDNATNFRGTDNALKKIDWQKISENECYPIKCSIPYCCLVGGWWEQLIRSVKSLPLRILGRSLVNLEELLTILCDVEASINSHPLTYISDDSDELIPLTPSLFLQDINKWGYLIYIQSTPTN